MDSESRKISLERAAVLKAETCGFTEFKKTYYEDKKERDKRRQAKKESLLEMLGGTESDWNDWHWQVSNRISDPAVAAKVLKLSDREKAEVEEVQKTYRWACTPYYLSLMDDEDHSYPINMMAIPTGEELDMQGESDPMDEEHTSPAACITRRYPNRLIINVTSACAMFCRHCQRRRLIGECDHTRSEEELMEAFDYIRSNPEIRDVLITGGDPMMMSDERIEFILKNLRAIEHVEILRIGTRVPVTMPQRITPELASMLKKYHPLYVNLQFNHPAEITPEAKKACGLLADAGIPLGNQMVFLKGINNDKYVVQMLNEKLLECRVRPYYIFHPKQVVGTHHFSISVSDGIEIMKYLRGHTSGLAIPTYILNAPGGLGKIPLLPEYIIENTPERVVLRTWEGKEVVITV